MNNLKNIEIILTRLQDYYKEKSMLSQFSNENPFFILIATILSARTKDETTAPIVKKLFNKYNSPQKLANADIESIKKIIKPIGFYNVKSKRIKQVSNIISKKGMPTTMLGLLQLPGVGHKTAACVYVYAFKKKEIPVDVHVSIISQRLGWTKEKDPKKIWVDLKNKIPTKSWSIINELFVIHGKKICQTRKPKCEICPITNYCPSAFSF